MENIATYKVVFQISNNDTFVQKSLLRQLTSLLGTITPIRIEVVTHGYGIDLLLGDSPYRSKLQTLERHGVRFLACEKTLANENMDTSGLVDFCRNSSWGVGTYYSKANRGMELH
jgi:uncharacterized protein